VSPELGVIDKTALDDALRGDPGKALHLLSDLTSATDESLREQARRLAGQIMLDLARVGTARRTGTATMRAVPADRGGDLDIDLSMDAIAGSRAEGRTPNLEQLIAKDWRRPDLALCLLVDSSGSMAGDRLAAAALAAAACSWRAPSQFAVVSFNRHVTVHRGLSASTPPVRTVTGLLELRGHGVTALAAALNAATEQLSSARAIRRVTILLSDCRATDEQDPLPPARAQQELIVLAPADDHVEAAQLVAAVGSRLGLLRNAADAPAAIAAALQR
jgi:Mg-chelatase subunit ChlD